MGPDSKVLLVEDHPIFADKLADHVGADDSGSYSATPPRGRFKWIASPQVAATFLKKESSRPGGWVPDLVLIDFLYEGFSETGLSVAAVAHQFAPSAQIVAFSGQAAEHGRLLFNAALHRWFECRRVLLKTGAASAYRDILAGVDTTPPAVAARLTAQAHLIDLLFYTPACVDILTTWDTTRGQHNVVAKLPGVGTKRTADRRLNELAQMGATFAAAFGMSVFGGSEHKARETTKERLSRFVDANRIFFSDPHLPEVVENARPWVRVKRADVVSACDRAGYPIANS